MSRAQFCDMGAPRRLNESNAPHFRKRLTSAMLEKSERVEIPKDFVHEHGDRFHRVLALTGPNGKSRSVALIVRSTGMRARTYLYHGWIGFARENGFQMGDELIFWLVARSSFRVALYSPQSLEKVTSTRTNSSESDEADGTSDAVTSELAPQHPKFPRQDLREGTSASITNHEEIQIPPCHVNNSNTVESQGLTACCVEAVPPQKLTSKVRKEEFAKYPGLNSAVSANSRFPQFVKRLTACNLTGKYLGPEIPGAFVKEHGDMVLERVILLGASDHLRVVKLQFAGCGRVHFGKGWKDFSFENGYSEGEVLLFSLVGVSTFVVKTFPGAS